MANMAKQNEAMLLLQDGSSSEDAPNLILNQDNLASLTSHVGKLPLSVISVVGPKKTGKSVVFGHMVKYLKALEKDEFEWINWDDKTTPLDDFQWPQGSSPDSAGVWCYPRSFNVKDDNGKEIAVILLYVQPSTKWRWNDDNSSSALAGLSLLLSSSTIFNVTKQLDEKLIKSIPAFISYAMLGGKAPFQNACFMVRDWSYPVDFPFGVSGGQDYVTNERLKECSGQSKEGRVSRQVINASFANISAALLPFPGNDAIKPGFQGSLAEMEEQFVETLKDVVADVVNAGDMPIKKNSNGIPITGEEWVKSLKDYVRKINSGDQPELDANQLLKSVGVKRSFLPGDEKQMMKKAMITYIKYWDRECRKGEDEFRSEAKLEEIHKSSKKRSLKVFQKELSLGEDDDGSNSLDGNKKKWEKLLKEKLDEKFGELKALEMKKKMVFVEKAQENLLVEYEKTMATMFPPERASKKPIVQRSSDQFVATSQSRFLEKVGVSKGEELKDEMGNAYEEFRNRLIDVSTAFINRLFPTDENFSMPYVGESNVSSTCISNLLQTASSHSKPVASKVLTSRNDSDLLNNMNKLSIKSEPVDPIPKPRHSNRQEDEEQKQATQRLILRLTTQHKSSLDSATTLDNLEKVHKTSMNDCVMSFVSECPYSEGTLQALHKDNLESELKTLYSASKTKMRKIQKEMQAKQEEAVKAGVRSYEDALTSRAPQSGDLEKVHAGLLKEEISKLSGALADPHLARARTQLEEEVELIFKRFKSESETKASRDIQAAKRVVTDCQLNYSDMMDEALKMAAITEAKLKKEHNRARDTVTTKLQTELKGKVDKQQLAKLQNELDEFVQKAFEGVKVRFQGKVKGSVGTEQLAYQQACTFYTEEMEKLVKNNVSILDADLLRNHKKISQTSLDKYSKQLSPTKLAELKKSLEHIFKKFKDENDMNMNMEPAIGIDLGTTFSCVSVYQKGEVKIIPNSVGKLTTPSYVAFPLSGDKPIVGEEAKRRAYENPEGTIFDAKRILGRKFDDPQLQSDMKLWPFTVIDGGRGIPKIEVSKKRLNPEEISANILSQLKTDAEVYLKRTVTKAVITVPAYFTDGQKQATMDAGKMAGLEVLSIVTEPVAAAMAYKLQYGSGCLDSSEEKHILIFDLGGGTFDVAVLKTTRGEIEVLTVDGDTHLGGEDFDKNMMDYCAAEFKKKNQIDLFDGKDSKDKTVRDDARRRLKRLQAECERQKIALADGIHAKVSVENICKNLTLEVPMSRTQFEKINQHHFDETIKVVEKALKNAKVSKVKIDDVVLVGGSTRIPKIQTMLKAFFGGKKELSKKINPDEAVAHGAGLMAAIKRGNVSENSTDYTKIQNVTPMPIGVEVYGGDFSIIIPKSTKIPVKAIESYKTAHNNQTSVQITIYEGEEKVAVKNKHLGDFYLNGIPPKDAGLENIEVEMDINDQGILHVTAKCSSTGRSKSITVTENKQRMSQAAIKRYIAEKTKA